MDVSFAPAPPATDKAELSNVVAEEAVLGSVLINPDALYDVVTFLRSEDFSLVKNRWVWEAIVVVHDRRDPIDFLTITSELENRGHLDEMGGPAYVSRLMDAVPSSIHAEAYGRMVEHLALRRRLVASAGQVAQLAFNRQESIEMVLDKAEQSIFAVSERRLTRDLQPIKEIIRAYYDRIQQLADRGSDVLGIPTGFKVLDQKLGGLQRSDLVIVAGRPGMGKTGLLLNFALHAARQFGSRVAVFTMEMSAEQVANRLVAAETRIDSQRLRTGKLTPDEWPRFSEVSGRLAETRVYIDDTPSLTPVQLRTKARRLYAEHGIDLILLDYLQLMSGDYQTDNRVQEISHISRQLKALARELDVPLVAAAQLSRAVEQRQDKRPMLSDLRESGSIEQDSDVVLFIYRDDYYSTASERPNIAEIHIAKHRNGPTATVELYYQKEWARFRDLETRRFDQ